MLHGTLMPPPSTFGGIPTVSESESEFMKSSLLIIMSYPALITTRLKATRYIE